MPNQPTYHQSYYQRNRARLQEYQRNLYYEKKKNKASPELVKPKQWIKVSRGEFIINFD